MRDGAVPAIALCLALGILLAYAPRRALLAAIVAIALVAIAVSAIVLPLEWQAYVVIACWAGTLLFALAIYVARPIPLTAAVLAAVLAGLMVGALTSEIGRPTVLALALPCVLVSLPASWLVQRRKAIVLKVLTSWIVAVAILSTGLTLAAGVNAGADHLE
ncbi:MAG: hypothetical protein ABR588_11955 [Sphingomicrobium sp.]